MNSLEEYAKDWKQIKSRQTSADKNFLNIKNKKIMNNIIQFEKQERRENKLGISLGLTGVLLGCLFGIALPIYLTPLNFNGVILSGVTLMLLGVLYMIIITRIERINLTKLDENSQVYLKEVKEKLENSGRRKSFHGFAYVAIIISGSLCLYWGIFAQIENGDNLFNYNLWMPILIGGLGWMIWRIRYSRKEKTKIQPLLDEIDQLLKGID